VLLMIEAHVFDAWTRPAARASTGFRYATILGGFAAPLFLWLAGLGVALSAARAVSRFHNRGKVVDALCRRGLQIFVLAFLFRLQAFIVSPGSHPITLFRVDILNIMGPAIVVAGLMWGLLPSETALTLAYASTAIGIAMVTPLVRTAVFVDRLPVWITWYVRPSGEYTTFTAFPWTGFVFAGAACGVLLVAAQRQGDERRLLSAMSLIGLLLLAIGLYTASLPSIYQHSSFWTSSPTYFAVRTGILLMALPWARAVSDARILQAWFPPLLTLGRNSLFVYWIHVELVYGYASWTIHRRLPLWGTLVAYAGFSAAMYGVVILRDHLTERWRARRFAVGGLRAT
jgi:uncharacterized membrane protein